MNCIINLTQHRATQEQLDQGVIDITSTNLKEILLTALTFNSLPNREDIEASAKLISQIAVRRLKELTDAGMEIDTSKYEAKAMIGGAPYLMSALEHYLDEAGIVPVYAYSERVSEEKHLEDGSVQKVNVFKHKGFIEY